MTDFLTKEQRSHRMSLIKGKDTLPERQMARLLRAVGLRFRRHRRDLPGRPDFALVGHRVAIFCDGEFWHGRDYPSLRRKLNAWWRAKIERNMARDKESDRALRSAGWRVLRFWEDDLRDPVRCAARMSRATSARASGR